MPADETEKTKHRNKHKVFTSEGDGTQEKA